MFDLGRLVRALSATAIAVSALALAPRPAAADDTLNVIAGAYSTAFFEVLNNVAQAAGYYKQEHLIVSTQYAGGPNVGAQLCATGKGDICGQSIEPLILGYDKGLRLTAFFVRDPQYDYVTGVLEDSPIKTLADFKGATIGEYSPSSPAELGLNAMLAGAGLRKDDVSYIVIGNGAQAVQALTTHKVAGAAFPFPELLAYEVQANIKFRWFFNPLIRDIGNTAYVASPDTIANKADQLKRFSRAQAMAAILIRENPAVAARLFFEGGNVKATPAEMQNEIRLLQLGQDQLPGNDPLSKRIGALPPVGIALYCKFLYDNGFAKSIVPASAIATDQFIAYAHDFDHKAFIEQVKRLR